MPTRWLALLLLHLLLAFMCTPSLAQKRSTSAYAKIDYSEVRTNLKQLAAQFPEVVLLENQWTKVGVDNTVECLDDGEQCVVDIVTVTDFATSSEEKVQVFIAGSLHG